MLPHGFHIHDKLLSKLECDDVINAFDSPRIARGRAGARNLMSCPAVTQLSRDPRLLELACKLHGLDMVPYKATLFEKTAKSNWLVAWHQDTALPIEELSRDAGWSSPSLKAGRLFAQAPAKALEKVLALRIHLDASTKCNGPLRVIPGSHTRGILTDDEIRELVTTVDPVECLTDVGGVIAMRPLLLHASSKISSDKPRRVLHIEYTESLDIAPGIKLAIS